MAPCYRCAKHSPIIRPFVHEMAEMADASELFDEPVIAGPFYLFEGSFIVEFLEPHPSRNASSVPTHHPVIILSELEH